MIVKQSAREKIAIAIHEGWMKWMQGRGYKYGFTRDEEGKTHPHMIDWDHMTDEDKTSTYAAADGVMNYLKREDVYI